MSFTSINPATGATIRTYPALSDSELTQRLESAGRAFQSWRGLTFAKRGAVLQSAAKLLRESAQSLAELMAREMGKPVTQGRAEVEKCAWACEYYAQEAERHLASEPVATDASKSYVAFEPLGVVLAVMPWNFPFWQVFRAAAPALMAGNTMVLKHASNVPGCAVAIDELFRKAEAPEGVFQNLLIDIPQLDAAYAHPAVKAVTLTGSTRAGQAVASKAGAQLKKTVLELGGSDPYLVLGDADLAAAAETCASSRMVNGGQSCIAAKRFIVEAPVRARFEQLMADRMRPQRPGDPLDESVTVGPLARRDLRDTLHDQVTRSVAQGAKVLLGGQVPDGPGAFYPPTILTGVRKGMAVYDEETFGPVAAIIEVADEAEAVRVANDSVFGLGAAVFTADAKRGERVARQLEAGCCFVNAQVRSDPRLPFGGIKQSGYGRELGEFGIREFVNIKTMYIK